MTRQALMAAVTALAMGLGAIAVTGTAQADNIFRAMNPFNWFFGDDWDDDYYDRHDRYRPYGWHDPYGWNGPYRGPGYAARPTVIVIEGRGQPTSDWTETVSQTVSKTASVHIPE